MALSRPPAKPSCICIYFVLLLYIVDNEGRYDIDFGREGLNINIMTSDNSICRATITSKSSIGPRGETAKKRDESDPW